MTQEERDLSRLLTEVSRHYKGRGFDPRAISVLRSTITSNTKGGALSIHNALQNFESAIASLVDHFTDPSPKSSEDDLQRASAIFAFSCGYQLADLEKATPANRLPGRNNCHLATMAASLKRRYGKRLYAQFEIAAAPALLGIEKYESTKEDIGTREVISQFMAIAESQNAKPTSVVVVAHGHHIERCIRLLDKYHRVTGLTPNEPPYYEYDPDECQPRAMSAENYIVSDFVSMAAMARDVFP